MSRRSLVVVGCVVAVCMGLAAPGARAESFLDLYLGAAVTQDVEGVLTGPPGSLPVHGRFETSFTVGGRLGHYFERLPWLGLAFDASFFQSDAAVTVDGLGTIEQIDLTVVPLSFLVFLRVPGLLATPTAPQGRLRPYLALGPSLVLSDAEVTIQSQSSADSSLDLGLDLRVGLGWQFNRTVGVFAEYRFSYVRPTFEDTIQGAQVSVDTDLATHHGLVGVSLRF